LALRVAKRQLEGLALTGATTTLALLAQFVSFSLNNTRYILPRSFDEKKS